MRGLPFESYAVTDGPLCPVHPKGGGYQSPYGDGYLAEGNHQLDFGKGKGKGRGKGKGKGKGGGKGSQPCRFGSQCTRADCSFFHTDRRQDGNQGGGYSSSYASPYDPGGFGGGGDGNDDEMDEIFAAMDAMGVVEVRRKQAVLARAAGASACRGGGARTHVLLPALCPSSTVGSTVGS